MDYEMETIIQALVIQINMVWNQFHEIIHELIRYAHALHKTLREPMPIDFRDLGTNNKEDVKKFE